MQHNRRHSQHIIEETSRKFQLQQTQSEGLTCLEFQLMSRNNEYTNPDLSVNSAIDGKTILIVDLNFKMPYMQTL